jgi:hypothetical protein
VCLPCLASKSRNPQRIDTLTPQLDTLTPPYAGTLGHVGRMQMGMCSGLMGGMTAAGAVLGLVCLGFFLPVTGAYPLYAAALVM